jgi:hypothetical protein
MLRPEDFPNAVAYAFEAVGGIGAAARVCGRTYQALNKWRQAGVLPRTEYSGETNYADCLAAEAAKRGELFDGQWLRSAASPQRGGQAEQAA